MAVIDYLQLVRPDKKETVREQEVAGIVRTLKCLAKELDIPILLLAQLNRQVENRASKIPNLSDLRESGAIEQDADVVMFLFEPEDGKSPPGTVMLSVGKNRHGATPIIPLSFRAEICRFDPA
jgi:replicative DNA helicase